jgi:hypothetical protein
MNISIRIAAAVLVSQQINQSVTVVTNFTAGLKK